MDRKSKPYNSHLMTLTCVCICVYNSTMPGRRPWDFRERVWSSQEAFLEVEHDLSLQWDQAEGREKHIPGKRLSTEARVPR